MLRRLSNVRRRVEQLATRVGRERLVLDLSCRRVDGGWRIACDRWQTLTDVQVSEETLHQLAPHCAEFLIHAADVEGLRRGIDEELVAALSGWTQHPMTYAGGARAIQDLTTVDTLSSGRIDLTFGSALDLFGGTQVRYADLLAYNHRTPP